jgi:hypothetical protein
MPRRPPAAVAFVAWTVLVWTTRLRNIWSDDALTTGEQVGRAALALSFTVLALLVAVALARRAGWLGGAVVALAAWTTVVWIARAIGIATGDHSLGFVVVHLVLAVASVALATWAVRATRQTPAASTQVRA